MKFANLPYGVKRDFLASFLEKLGLRIPMLNYKFPTSVQKYSVCLLAFFKRSQITLILFCDISSFRNDYATHQVNKQYLNEIMTLLPLLLISPAKPKACVVSCIPKERRRDNDTSQKKDSKL